MIGSGDRSCDPEVQSSRSAPGIVRDRPGPSSGERRERVGHELGVGQVRGKDGSIGRREIERACSDLAQPLLVACWGQTRAGIPLN